MRLEELSVALAWLAYTRGHLVPWDKMLKEAQEALVAIRRISYEAVITEEATDAGPAEEVIAELNDIDCTTSYATVVKFTVPSGKKGYIRKVEMACDTASEYSIVQWEFYVNSKLVEIQTVAGGRWTDKVLPGALTMTFPDLEIQGGKFIEIKAKDDGTGATVHGDITGMIR